MPSDQKEQKEQNVLISIDDVKKDFEDFLNVDNNHRIFFSGMYGIGKTFFLREFAKAKENEFFIIHLYPVNYQIRENSLDIVELLKYDILIEFLCKEKDTVKQILNEYAEGRDFCSFLIVKRKELSKKGADLLSNLPDTISVIGKSLKVALDIHDAWKLFKEKEKIGLENFLEREKDKLKETDFLSQLIRDVNKRIEKEKQRQTILILDDLDRLDPDNIFRILNVFSAFFDKENENKFGFSKIIIVGDYENIKKIFHHKYGQDTDFQGYMDKFFSIKPYEFDNNAAIEQKIDFLVKNIKASFGKLSDLNSFPKRTEYLQKVNPTEYIVRYFFIQAVKCNVINLRQLLKGVNFQIPVLIFKEQGEKKYFDLGLKTLFIIFNEKENFLDCVFKILQQQENNKFNFPDNYETFFKVSIYLMLKVIEKQRTFDTKETVKGYVYNDFKTKDFQLDHENQRVVETDLKSLERSFLIVLAKYIPFVKYGYE